MDAFGEPHQLHGGAGGGGVETTGVTHQQAQVFPAAEIIIKRRGLEDGPNLTEGSGAMLAHGNAADGDIAGVRRNHPEDDAEGGAFTGSVVT